MKRFAFEAARADGQVVKGMLAAAHRAAAVDELAARRLFPLVVREAEEPRRARSLPRRDLAIFFRSMATLLRAGVPLDRALSAIRVSPRLRRPVDVVRRRVREGESLSRALAHQGGVPPVALGLVRAGERAGLEYALEQTAQQLEREADLRAQVRSALAYPTVLLAVGTGAVGLLVVGVLPRFVQLLGDAGSALPKATQLLLAVSGLLRGHWLVATVGVALAAALTYRWTRTVSGLDVLLAFPIVGRIRMGLATARVARTLGTLLRLGSQTLVALSAAAEGAGDRAIARRLGAAAERVRSGSGLCAALEAERALSPEALQLLSAGERSAKVGELLDHAAMLAEADATRTLNTAVRLIEPALILALGGMVAFVALALLQAVYGLRVA